MKIKKQIPYDFILEELTGTDYDTKPMFGCTAIYVGDKIMLILRKKEEMDEDTGLWVCIPDEYTQEMKAKYPQLKGVSFFSAEDSAWQCLHETNEDFEPLALEFCKMIKKGDPRIGRMPKPKKKKLIAKVEAAAPIHAPKKKKTEQAEAKKARKKLKAQLAAKKRKR